MRYILFLLPLLLFAEKSIYTLFKERYYTYICNHRWKYINKYSPLKDEKTLSLVAYSCLKKHFLTPALDLAKVLRYTKIGRNNATYITTLFLMKNLIIRYVKDGFSEKVELPYIEGDLLAKIFYLTFSKKPKVTDLEYEVKEKDFTYKVFVDIKKNNIIIKTFKNSTLIKKDLYW